MKWTNEMKEFVSTHSGTETDAQGLEAFNASFGVAVKLPAYRRARQALGLKKCPGRGVKKLAVPAMALQAEFVIAPKQEEIVNEVSNF